MLGEYDSCILVKQIFINNIIMYYTIVQWCGKSHHGLFIYILYVNEYMRRRIYFRSNVGTRLGMCAG